MFIIQGLLNTPSLVLYNSKNRLKTRERFALLDPQILMRGARLTALLPFDRMRRLIVVLVVVVVSVVVVVAVMVLVVVTIVVVVLIVVEVVR